MPASRSPSRTASLLAYRMLRSDLLSSGLVFIALLLTLIAAREGPNTRRFVHLGLAALLVALAMTEKVQALLPALTIPVIALAFGRDERDTGAPAASQGAWLRVAVLCVLGLALIGPTVGLLDQGIAGMAEQPLAPLPPCLPRLSRTLSRAPRRLRRHLHGDLCRDMARSTPRRRIGPLGRSRGPGLGTARSLRALRSQCRDRRRQSHRASPCRVGHARCSIADHVRRHARQQISPRSRQGPGGAHIPLAQSPADAADRMARHLRRMDHLAARRQAGGLCRLPFCSWRHLPSMRASPCAARRR